MDISDSGGSCSNSSVDSDPNDCLDINCNMTEKFDQGIGPWLFDVLTSAIRHEEEEVATVHAYLIKREEIQVHDNKKKSLRQAMKDEDSMLNAMFALPKIFHPHGHVNPDFLLPLGQCFIANDMQVFHEKDDATEHPANRAWILLIRDLLVTAEYRRLGIGGNMIRKTLQTVLHHCIAAGRPLLVVVQPKRIDEDKDEQWPQVNELAYHRRVNQVFWEDIGFKRYKNSFSGFTAPWYFWGTELSLPSKKRIAIPDNVAVRNTRTATPPLRPRTPPDRTRPTPFDSFPVFEDTESGPALRPSRAFSTCPSAPPMGDSAPGNNAAGTDWWFDNPDDPSITPEYAQTIRKLMRTMDTVGKKYQLKPIKEPVQTSAAPPMARQSKCPFKAPSGAVAPTPFPLPPKPPSAISSFQKAAAPGQFLPPAAQQGALDQSSSVGQPGSHYMVMYVLEHSISQNIVQFF